MSVPLQRIRFLAIASIAAGLTLDGLRQMRLDVHQRLGREIAGLEFRPSRRTPGGP